MQSSYQIYINNRKTINQQNNLCSEPAEIIETDEVTWFVKNQFHQTYWDKIKDAKYKVKDEVKEKLDVNVYGSKFDNCQLDKFKENEKEIELLSKKNIYTKDKLMKILNECSLIKRYEMPNDILLTMTLFTGNGIISINYRCSCLPFFVEFKMGKHVYIEHIKKWWDEIRLSPNNYTTFYPSNIHNASKEFDEFLITKFAENGDGMKYQFSMIPHIKIDKKYNIWNDKHILLTLPTKYSKCVGGIELFQRLYLESAFNGDSTFNADLIWIEETHGDNWCFDGNGMVLMGNGEYKRIDQLKVGDKLLSFPNNISTIQCRIVSNINDKIEMVKLSNNCWITFEHPIFDKYG